MDRREQVQYLNQALLAEMPQYREQAESFPADEISQRRLLRSLMNVRPPMPLAPKFLEVQDALLSAEREGDLLRISYEVWTEVYTVLDGEGNASEISGRKVYSAVMTVELLDGGGFQYRSVEVMPEEAA